MWPSVKLTAAFFIFSLGALVGQPTEVSAKLAFYDATTQKVIGHKKEAIALYEKVIQLDPKNAAAYHAIADLWSEMGRPQQALPYAEQAWKFQPENRWFGALLAELYGKLARPEDAIRVYSAMIDRAPYDNDLRFSLIEAMDQAGDVKGALRELRGIKDYDLPPDFAQETEVLILKHHFTGKKLAKALLASFKYYPQNAHASFALGEMYREQGQLALAWEWFTVTESLEPTHPRVHLYLAQLAQETGKPGEAMVFLRKAFENPKADTENKFRILGMLLSRTEQFPLWRNEARQLAKILEASHPEDPRAATILGDLALQTNEFEQALKYYQKAIKEGNGGFQLWEQVLRLEASLAQWEDLSRDGKKATELFPTHPLPFLYLGNALFQLKEYEQADLAYRSGKDLLFASDRGLEQKFLTSMAQLYHYMEKYQKSDACFEAALDIDPKDALAMNNYAYFLSLRNDQLEKALSMAEFATKTHPLNPHYQDTKGIVLGKMGRLEEALTALRIALQAGGDKYPEILENYGDLLYQSGQQEEALVQWKKALEVLNAPSETLERKIQTGRP